MPSRDSLEEVRFGSEESSTTTDPARMLTPSSGTDPGKGFSHVMDMISRRESDASGPARLALDIIQSEPKDHDISFSDGGKIVFDRLHLLYHAGSTIYSSDEGGWRAYRIDKVERASGPAHAAFLHVHAFYVNFDEPGKRLVPQHQLLVVPWYSSARRIRSLDLWSDWYIHKTYLNLPKKLFERGKHFWGLRGDRTSVARKLQPLDVGCFGSLKQAYGRQIEGLMRMHINYRSKLEFLCAFREAFFASITERISRVVFQGLA
ncbi:hypothetical protein N657DRAFT_678750 [Parathielavia appendiculata]|uniref:DUF7025 domain-containing protein n=1 Tax=Parathielavia appendiculata TaxID=2587402 RepID=A0AAN6Z668_9PEZI|nr:hypothetical protein N657DRAFT_678750 [Parathielavia appendiculata]